MSEDPTATGDAPPTQAMRERRLDYEHKASAAREALEGALAHCEKCHWCADHVSIAIRAALAALAAPASAGGGEPVYYGIDGGNMTPPIPQGGEAI